MALGKVAHGGEGGGVPGGSQVYTGAGVCSARRLSAGNTRKLYVAGVVWICRQSKIEIDGRLSENLSDGKSISKPSAKGVSKGGGPHEVSSTRLAPLHVSNMLNITDLVLVMANPVVVAHRLRPRGAMPEDLCVASVSVCVCAYVSVCACLAHMPGNVLSSNK